jgi:hypothetical protein
MRLYGISREEVKAAVQSPDFADTEGGKSIAYKAFRDRFGAFPLKVVYLQKDAELFVITVYPLKRARWKERR